MESAQSLMFFVNGQKVEVQSPDPRTTLLQYLRQNLYLTGTKEACGQGGCGACTVMLSVYDAQLNKISHISANACLIPLCYLHGMAVTTVEGIGSTRNGLHPVQESLVMSHGMQCGFCTPGMVMSMYTLLKNNPNPTDDQLERGLEGNLCRCTGYRPIVEAFKTARKNCPCGLGLCSDKEDEGDMDVTLPKPKPLHNTKTEKTQDVIFPPELQLKDKEYKKSVAFKCNSSTWHRPSTLGELLDLKSKYPSALLVMGCNSVGYQIRKGILSTQNIICATNVPELTRIHTDDKGVEIGAGVTLTRMEIELRDISRNVKDPKNRNLVAILDMVRWTAADQIRNTATIGGHIMSKGANLELQTLLFAAGATLRFLSKGKEPRSVPYDEDFFRNGIAEPSDVLISVSVPFTDKTEHIVGMKQPHRRGFDFGIVLASMYVKFQNDSNIVEKMRLTFGGLSSKPLIASKSSDIAVNRSWADDLVTDVCDSLIEELKNDSFDDMKFRLALACSFFLRFHHQIKLKLEIAVSDVSGASMLSFPPSKGMQFYDIPEAEGKGFVWKPVVNVTGDSIAAGETQFVDDIHSYKSELFAAPVTSKRAHARIKSIDASKALAMKGVLMFLDHRDVPNNNNYEIAGERDMYLFAVDEVRYFGQIIGAVLAEDRDVARSAAQLVEVTYEDLEAIFTIEEAIRNNSFYKNSFTVDHGDVDKAFQDSDFLLEGESQSGAVDHFYFEPQSAIVIPKKDQKEVEVLTSSQALTSVQEWIAACLGVPRNRVLTKVKRCGGGFGGKFSDSIIPAGIAAVGAWKTNRPVRCVYDRVSDINITGKRHPSKVTYKVGFNTDGKILGIDAKFFYNAGHSTDVSFSVLQIGMVMFMSGYNIANAREIGRICRTNTPSNTAFRGYGGPQSFMAMENIIQNVAHKLSIPPEKVREINLMRKGETNSFKKTMTDDNLYRCWQECTEFSNYPERLAAVKEYNSYNRWKKKGLAMTPVMFPVGYPPIHMNQSAALAMVYLDGSVLLAHGGVEIGQGMNTKAVQVAATVLDIPMDKIAISETSTGTVPNATETGGTFASELNAGAVADACRKLRDRLEPYKKQAPEGSWDDWVHAAHMDRVSLSATGFFKTKRNSGYDWEKNTGECCQYFTFGTACTEVEIDCLTGEHQINRTDIVMDVGKSLNPAVNTGQIEGGFVQGTGMLTTEKLYLTSEGRMISSGPLNYKIPGVRSIPREFRVKLLKDSEGDKDIYSAKGIGEPPLLLSMSVYQALKAAILAAREDSGLTDNFHLPCPATVEAIRMSCQDEITQKCEKTALETCKTTRITI